MKQIFRKKSNMSFRFTPAQYCIALYGNPPTCHYSVCGWWVPSGDVFTPANQRGEKPYKCVLVYLIYSLSSILSISEAYIVVRESRRTNSIPQIYQIWRFHIRHGGACCVVCPTSCDVIMTSSRLPAFFRKFKWVIWRRHFRDDFRQNYLSYYYFFGVSTIRWYQRITLGSMNKNVNLTGLLL